MNGTVRHKTLENNNFKSKQQKEKHTSTGDIMATGEVKVQSHRDEVRFLGHI